MLYQALERKIKRQAIKDFFKAFPSVMANTGAMLGNNVVKVLTKKKTKKCKKNLPERKKSLIFAPVFQESPRW